MWLHSYMKMAGLGPGCPLESATFSRLVQPFTLLSRVADGKVVASLGNARWAWLAWPVVQVSVDADQRRVWQLKPTGAIEWHHLTNPDQWQVLPFACHVAECGIAMKQEAEPVSIIKHCLLQKHCLTHDDLKRIANHLRLETAAAATRQTLLLAIAEALADGDAGFVDAVLAAESRTAEKDMDEGELCHDPLVERCLQEADADDAGEFNDIKQSIDRRRMRDRVQAWRQGRNAVTKAKARPKRKASAKPKAKRSAHFIRRLRRRIESGPQPQPAEPMPASEPAAGPARLPPPLPEPPGSQPDDVRAHPEPDAVAAQDVIITNVVFTRRHVWYDRSELGF